MSSGGTRQRLESAALAVLREGGIAGLSARAVARRAGVNQALIFYHYDSLAKLIRSAALASVTAAVEQYRPTLNEANSFAELFATGQRMNAAERDAGNVKVMAQLLAGGHLDATIGDCARACINQWVDALQPVIERLVKGSPLVGVIDPDGLTRAISSAFIGLELYEGVDADGAESAATSLQQLGTVLEAVETLGPVATRAIRAQIRRKSGRR